MDIWRQANMGEICSLHLAPFSTLIAAIWISLKLFMELLGQPANNVIYQSGVGIAQ